MRTFLIHEIRPINLPVDSLERLRGEIERAAERAERKGMERELVEILAGTVIDLASGTDGTERLARLARELAGGKI